MLLHDEYFLIFCRHGLLKQVVPTQNSSHFGNDNRNGRKSEVL